MTRKEAYRILGLSAGAEAGEIKKRYRYLMMQVHPDTGAESAANYPYDAREINKAYAFLKKERFAGCEQQSQHEKKSAKQRKTAPAWDAPLNPHAFREREILHYVEDCEGNILGHFCGSKGKYMWKTEEDFSLFLLSIYRCGKQLLDEIDRMLCRREISASRSRIHAELAYLLAQQFIDGTALLEELAREQSVTRDGNRIFYIASSLEYSGKKCPLASGELLHPSSLRQHRLYLKNQAGQELGYLSFRDDRLYYVIIPLFEQKKVQVKIQAGDTAVAGFHNLQVWLKLLPAAPDNLPENLNLRIERLLREYRS